jgi:hypothetical protein
MSLAKNNLVGTLLGAFAALFKVASKSGWAHYEFLGTDRGANESQVFLGSRFGNFLGKGLADRGLESGLGKWGTTHAILIVSISRSGHRDCA